MRPYAHDAELLFLGYRASPLIIISESSLLFHERGFILDTAVGVQ